MSESVQDRYKQPWHRRAKNRGKYHELELGKLLHTYGWGGRRIPVSGPYLGWADVVAVRQTESTFDWGFFQMKPRVKTNSAYFSGKQITSLLMLHQSFAGSDHGGFVRVHEVLVARLKGRKLIFHKVVKEDLEKVGLTESILSRLPLDSPRKCMLILKSIPSPVERDFQNKPLKDYYDYIGRTVYTIHGSDASNWDPADPDPTDALQEPATCLHDELVCRKCHLPVKVVAGNAVSAQ
jgi:Holliday junction resolvase